MFPHVNLKKIRLISSFFYPTVPNILPYNYYVKGKFEVKNVFRMVHFLRLQGKSWAGPPLSFGP